MYLDKIITSPSICTEYFPKKKKHKTKRNETLLPTTNSYQTCFSFFFRSSQVSVGKFSAPAAAPTHRQHSNLRATGRAPKAKNPKFYNTSESESDSDLEPPGHRVSTQNFLHFLSLLTYFVKGESIFWRRKIRTFHGILDVNKDGVISYDDFILFGERFIELGHLSEKHTQEFRNLLKVSRFVR
jgi:hypothetical protein